tara:strand:+ start:119 stop:334 length:216 start_codon:yes stop_codon:yes gene_type:complete
MKYEIKENLNIGDKELKKGSIVEHTDIPNKSVKWLKDQGLIVKIDNNYKAKMLEEVIDDYDTEFEEVLEEE